MSKDTIYRQAAIDAMIEWYGCEPSDIDDFRKIVDKLPSADRPQEEGIKNIIVNAPLETERLQEWIPCSERLPNKNGEYLVTIIQNESSFQQGVTDIFIRSLAPANILYGKGFGEQLVWRQELWEDIVAWMPLPEPWKGANNK